MVVLKKIRNNFWRLFSIQMTNSRITKCNRLSIGMIGILVVFLVALFDLNLKAWILKDNTNNEKQKQNSKKEMNISREIILDEQEWLIQFKVLQKTAIFVVEMDNSITIETLMFLTETNRSYTNSYVESSLRCICNINGELLFLDQIEYRYIDSDEFLWRLKFKLPNAYNKTYTNATIAVVDFADYKMKKNKYGTDLIVLYHQPLFFTKKYPKIPAVASCVHTIGNLKRRTIARLDNWVRVQREINIAAIRLNFIESKAVEWPDILEIPIRNGFTNAKLVKYKITIEENCAWIENMMKMTNNTYLPRLYNECVASNQKFLRAHIDPHEKMCDNDCYMKTRYVYEYVTNYDFDEIIFPRQMQINDYSPYMNLSSCGHLKPFQKIRYNIYDYIHGLHTRYEREDNKLIGALHFEHYLAVSSSANFFEVVKQTDNHVHLNLNGRDVFLEIGNTQADNSLLEAFKHVLGLIECLFKRNRFTYFDYVWTSPFLVRIDDRIGKSVYVTNRTELINQHGPEVKQLLPNTEFKLVPIQDGFSGHYRPSGMDHFPFNFSLTSDKVRFELEFYLLLLKIELNDY